MHPFRWAISLRIRHPKIDAAEITETLRLDPHLTAPTVLSYWCHRYNPPQDSECAVFIYAAACALQEHATFLRRVRAEGGRVEFFVGWASMKNFGDIFQHEALALLGELQIDLSFDVYPNNNQI